MDTPPIIKTVVSPLESKVEYYYKKEIAKIGGVSFKFTSPQRRSVTDQVTLTAGRVLFVEIKRVGNTLSNKQKLFRDTVLAHNCEHATVIGHSGVDAFITELKQTQLLGQQILGCKYI